MKTDLRSNLKLQFLGAVLLTVGWMSVSVAQTPSEGTKKSEIEIPAPEELTLRTNDGVDLRSTYFKPAIAKDGSDLGKQTLPFILIHDWEGSRNDLWGFAEQLQRIGNAVIVPDLRGHGESTMMAGVVIDFRKFRKLETASMINDIEACKKFLVGRNNEGELNIDLLNVIAVGQSSVLAVNWAIRDWYGFPPYRGSIKQGQDIKSLTLIGPSKKIGQLNGSQDFKHPMFAGRNPQIPNLPTLVVWAENNSAASKESAQIFESMKKGRPDVEKIKDQVEKAEQETVFDVTIPNSTLSVTELIQGNDALRKTIIEFVVVKVGSKRDQYPWQSRAAK